MARSATPEGIEPETLTADEQAAMDADRAADTDADGAASEAPPGEAAPPASESSEADPVADGQPPRQGMVPHAALHEAREKLKTAEARASEAERKERLLEERTNLILQRFAPPPAPAATPAQAPPAIPSFEEDPAGHILGQVRQQGAILGELVQAVTGQARQSEASQGVQQMTARAAAMEREFAKANPDYDAASNYLFELRRQQLITGGWDNPAEIDRMLASEAYGLAKRAMEQGVDPAERVYNLAKISGYKPAENGSAAPNGSTPPAGEAQLRTIAAGQQQARSVGAMPGAGPSPLTAARLLELSDEEFADMQKKNPKAMRDLMGA
jgi:hypothetical protein